MMWSYHTSYGYCSGSSSKLGPAEENYFQLFLKEHRLVFGIKSFFSGNFRFSPMVYTYQVCCEKYKTNISFVHDYNQVIKQVTSHTNVAGSSRGQLTEEPSYPHVIVIS